MTFLSVPERYLRRRAFGNTARHTRDTPQNTPDRKVAWETNGFAAGPRLGAVGSYEVISRQTDQGTRFDCPGVLSAGSLLVKAKPNALECRVLSGTLAEELWACVWPKQRSEAAA